MEAQKIHLLRIDFEFFKAECEKWLNAFGLKDWVVKYCFTKQEDIIAEVSWNTIDRFAIIRLSTVLELEWLDEYPTVEAENRVINAQLKATALHEVTHLLFADLDTIATTREFSEISLDRNIHKIIRTFETLMNSGILSLG